MDERPQRPGDRVFLVVVDDSPELRAALSFACARARKGGGRVALLRVIEPAEFQHFLTINNLMKAEARQEAEELLQRVAAEVNARSGQLPVLYVREGEPRDELLRLIEEERSISVLVLAADPGPGGPGPLIQAMAGRLVGRLRVPLMVVPGHMTDEEIEKVT